jgi:hypothetical protein
VPRRRKEAETAASRATASGQPTMTEPVTAANEMKKYGRSNPRNTRIRGRE